MTIVDRLGDAATLELLRERHPAARLRIPEAGPGSHRDATIEIDVGSLRAVCRTLRDHPSLRFDFLMSVAAIDRPPDAIDVVFHLFSYAQRHTLALRTRADRSDPRVPSVATVWPAAGWHEREQYDLMGVVFEDHPDLRRILLPDDWEGHPLRKDYVKPDRYHGIDNTRPKNA